MDALGSALNGLRAGQLQLDTSANDVANLDTPGFRPGGVPQDPAPQSAAEGPSGTDLGAETAVELTGSIAYAANARVIDASTQMTRSLIDVLA